MAIVKFFFIQPKMLQSVHTLGAVPGVGEQHTSYIPEDGTNRQEAPLVGSCLAQSVR